jgi:hypothetical protein
MSQENDINDILGKKPKLEDVTELLADYQYAWREIGTALKVKAGKLMGLRQSPDSDSSKLTDVIRLWTSTKCSPVTWDNLIASVESDTAGNLADLGDYMRSELAKDKYFKKYD